jgi:NADPH-dependent 7-cyano-7-deazaguanine reductase QueF-like protein
MYYPVRSGTILSTITKLVEINVDSTRIIEFSSFNSYLKIINLYDKIENLTDMHH